MARGECGGIGGRAMQEHEEVLSRRQVGGGVQPAGTSASTRLGRRTDWETRRRQARPANLADPDRYKNSSKTVQIANSN